MLLHNGVDVTRQGIEKHLAILGAAGPRGEYKLPRLDATPLRTDVEQRVRRFNAKVLDRR